MFDQISAQHGVERIKTIGDAYMAVAGLNNQNSNHANIAVNFALSLQKSLKDYNQKYQRQWHMRVGIHSGSVVAGVIGQDRHAFDLWGDAVNTASRIETACESGKINISKTTKKLCGSEFLYQPRGRIEVKNKKPIEMFFISRKTLRSGLSSEFKSAMKTQDNR